MPKGTSKFPRQSALRRTDAAFALLERFKAEHDAISKYVDLLHARMRVRGSDVGRLLDVLRTHGVKLSANDALLQSAGGLDFATLSLILDAFKGILPLVKKKRASAAKRASTCAMPEYSSTTAVSSTVSEWVEWFVQRRREGLLEPQMKEEARSHIAGTEVESGSEEESAEFDAVEYAITASEYILRWREVSELESILDQYEELVLVSRMYRPDAEVNVTRQGFILLMAVFDGTLFDLVRLAMERDFFRIAAEMGSGEKLACKDLAKYSTFEQFRTEVAESLLATRYAKDLLALLDKLHVPYIRKGTGLKNVHLWELIQRRNLHIHCRGVVDQRYVELSEGGKARYNIYNLRLGQYAEIDKDYWLRGQQLCLDCVALVAGWAAGLRPQPERR